MMLDPNKMAYTLDELAAELGCHKETLRRHIRDGKLKAAKIGKDWKISRLELEAYWQARGGGKLFPEET